MKIKDLLRGDFIVNGSTELDVSGISFDSRRTKPGDIFFAIKGENLDGNLFIRDAIKKGALSIVYQKGLDLEVIKYFPNITWIGVDDCRDALAFISHIFYGKPSEHLDVIGITGTNGKTTTSYLIKKIVEGSGNPSGLIGTISYFIKDRRYEAVHTTPEAPLFQWMLKEMLKEGCKYVVSEISSHALSQKRVDYTKFKMAVFTNLTRDHLDFHRDMEDYFLAKRRLFKELLSEDGTSIINQDDPYGQRLLGELRRLNKKVISYTIGNGAADIKAQDIETTFKGTRFTLKIQDSKTEQIISPLIGISNVYNILSAIAVTLTLGIQIDNIKASIAEMDGIKGRFEKVDVGQKFLAIIDYAHTGDALERLLLTAKNLVESNTRAGKRKDNKGKIITVFGCGGNRDKGKRSIMGEIATRLSDFVIITSDNPRDEDPREIIKDIEKGIDRDNYIVVPDRKIAIELAVNIASPGDILLVAGKGHEDYQEINGVRYRFSDKASLEEAIKNLISTPHKEEIKC
jgi:UDP-N-acetylmuramoyl-L-alanyl-D-glutamate--2,6-diaminopimelate ligase